MIGAAGISNFAMKLFGGLSGTRWSSVTTSFARFSSRLPDNFSADVARHCLNGRDVHAPLSCLRRHLLGGGGGSITAGSIKTPASAGGCSSITSSSPTYSGSTVVALVTSWLV